MERIGLTYHTCADGSAYWDESAYWEFSAAEIDRLEAATAEVQRMALAAGDFILTNDRLKQMQIPEVAWARIRATWESEPPALYGRLDLAYDGRQIKLLEYNADTPTALVETAVAQWYWLEDCFPKADQFNSLHEKLIAKWKDLNPYVSQPMHFAHDGSEEDAMTVAYLRDTAQQAGLRTEGMTMHEIGWEDAENRFVDLQGLPIRTLFKLYPWEWMLKEDFGSHALATMNATSQSPVAGMVQWIEPIWKMLWSNKALLAILWEMNPNHELLLPAYLDGPRNMQNYVRKPLFGREGAGITVFRNWIADEGAANEGAGGVASDAGGFVYQGLASMAQADGKTAVFGSWLVDGEPAGMGIRESDGLITTNTSRFVPHLFR
ncbi:glutathionylspermidine synthase family protein [Acidicapsa ligni]|uniref:glutathionylspermidine synthase family protein n=1 Tax=Acidicapsa ligni TaxID=542300 RepID=UPI0021DF81EF|nr:glutathionylspermidine synthase family protein [Acidicapsa ligni]